MFDGWKFLAGTVLTAIMQSSSAAIAVILTTLFADIIDFEQAAAMVIGANVGKDRLASLIDQTARVVQAPDDESIDEELKGFFQSVEAADKRFIRLCAQAVSKGTIREHEVTRLLMANRFFTQSNRMVVLSMQALTRGFSFPEDRVHSHNHGWRL